MEKEDNKLQTTSSGKSLVNITEFKISQTAGQSGNGEVSVYKGQLTIEVVIEQNLRIRQAFPQLTSDWFDLFQERLKANNFTNKRLIDAVDHVIDTWTNTFTPPHIGHFISFDKRIKVLNDIEMQQLMNKEGQSISRYYQMVKIGDKILYAHKNDVKEFNLEIYKPKPLNGKPPEADKINHDEWIGFAGKVLKVHGDNYGKV